MRRRVPSSLWPLLTIFFVVSCNERLDTERIVEGTRSNYEEMEDYRCTFVQTVDSDAGDMAIEGEILAKEEKMRLNLKMPLPSGTETVEQLVIFDGEVIWTYNSVSDAAQKIDLSRLAPATRQRIREQYQMRLLVPEFKHVEKVSDLGDLYLIETGEEGDVSLPHSRIHYYVDKDDLLVQRIEVIRDDEVVTSIELDEIEVNSGIGEDVFMWEPPEGIPVTDITENVGNVVN